MPHNKKLKKLSKYYEKGSKKNGKYKEYKYVKRIRAEKEAVLLEKKLKSNNKCLLHIFIIKLYNYEPGIVDLVLGFLNNPIKKQLYAIECIYFLRQKKDNIKSYLSNSIMFDYYWNKLSYYDRNFFKVIFNINEQKSEVYFGDDGHMLEWYEYTDNDIEKDPLFGILSAQRICQLYDRDYIIKKAHIYKYDELELDNIMYELIHTYKCNSIYVLAGSDITKLFKNYYNIEPNILPITYVRNKKGEDVEESYYEILLYGKNIVELNRWTSNSNVIDFSYGFNKFMGLNIHTTPLDLKLKYHNITNISKDFQK